MFYANDPRYREASELRARAAVLEEQAKLDSAIVELALVGVSLSELDEWFRVLGTRVPYMRPSRMGSTDVELAFVTLRETLAKRREQAQRTVDQHQAEIDERQES